MDVFDLKFSSPERLDQLSDDGFAHVLDFLRKDVSPIDRNRVLMGICHLVLKEAIRTNPADPEPLMRHVMHYMAETAAIERYRVNFVYTLGIGAHPNAEGTEHAPS